MKTLRDPVVLAFLFLLSCSAALHLLIEHPRDRTPVDCTVTRLGGVDRYGATRVVAHCADNVTRSLSAVAPRVGDVYTVEKCKSINC